MAKGHTIIVGWFTGCTCNNNHKQCIAPQISHNFHNMHIISKCSCRPHNTTWQAMGWRPTIYNLTVQITFTLHFYRLIYRFMPQFGNQAVYTKVITTNLMFLNKAFPHSMLKSFQVTAHDDTFPPYNIFFSSAIKFVASHSNLNIYFNEHYSTFWWHSITLRNMHIIINAHYAATCIHLSMQWTIILSEDTLRILQQNRTGQAIIFLRQRTEKVTEYDPDLDKFIW